MPRSNICLFSPLSFKSIQDGKYSNLLLHFLLVEIFRGLDAEQAEDPRAFLFSPNIYFFPYDWTSEIGPLNKFAEHVELLPYAFPKKKKESRQLVKAFEKIISRLKKPVNFDEVLEMLQRLFSCLQPFLIASKDSEPLQFFLSQHQESIKRLCAQNINSFLKIL